MGNIFSNQKTTRSNFLQKIKRNSLIILLRTIPKKFIFQLLIKINNIKLMKAILKETFRKETYFNSKRIYEFTPPQPNQIVSINYSPSGESISIVCLGKLLFIYGVNHLNRKTFGQIILKILMEEDYPTCSSYSPSGSHIAVGFQNKKILIFGVNPLNTDIYGKQILCLSWGKESASSISYSSNGDYLAVARKGEPVIIYGVNPLDKSNYGKQILKFYKNEMFLIYSVCYSPVSNSIALGSLGKTVILYYIDLLNDDFFQNNIEQKILEEDVNTDKRINNIIKYSPNGEYLVTGTLDKKLIIYGSNYYNTTYYGKILHKIEGYKNNIDSISFSYSGNYLAIGIHDSNEDYVYYVGPDKKNFGKQVNKLNSFNKSVIKSLCFSPSRPFLACVCNIRTVVIYY